MNQEVVSGVKANIHYVFMIAKIFWSLFQPLTVLALGSWLGWFFQIPFWSTVLHLAAHCFWLWGSSRWPSPCLSGKYFCFIRYVAWYWRHYCLGGSNGYWLIFCPWTGSIEWKCRNGLSKGSGLSYKGEDCFTMAMACRDKLQATESIVLQLIE